MKPIFTTLATAILLISGSVTALAQDDDAKSAKSAYATELIERAAKFLGDQEQFSVSAEIWEDIVIEGNKLQFTRTADAMVRRPDRIQVNMAMYQPTRSFYYNGKTVTMIDHQTDFYGSTAAESTIDATIIAMDAKFDTQFPLEDLLFSKPFGNAAENATSSQYLGKVNLLGQECQHVAFQYPGLQWQAWIATGPQPVLLKVIVERYDEVDEMPSMTALFSNWDFTTPLPDFVFEFHPHANQLEIQLEPTVSAQPAE